jgi:RimJ/RimL family protein N-acetyltransferase
MAHPDAVHIEPWGPNGLALLEKLNAPAMTRYLGGPESPEKLAERQQRYELLAPPRGRAFQIVEEVGGDSVGAVVYWSRKWREEEVLEIGWAVLPDVQGRGIAATAVAQAIASARAEGRNRFLLAFPAVGNAASNALCGKLGFEQLGEHDFEYPKGHFTRCNEWRLDLEVSPARQPSGADSPDAGESRG